MDSAICKHCTCTIIVNDSTAIVLPSCVPYIHYNNRVNELNYCVCVCVVIMSFSWSERMKLERRQEMALEMMCRKMLEMAHIQSLCIAI